jgi:hypothetical protein
MASGARPTGHGGPDVEDGAAVRRAPRGRRTCARARSGARGLKSLLNCPILKFQNFKN